jgi:hypothetical protein
LLSYFSGTTFFALISLSQPNPPKRIPSQQKYQQAGNMSYDLHHALRARLLFAAIQFSRIIHHRPDHTSSGTAASRLLPRQVQQLNQIQTPCQYLSCPVLLLILISFLDLINTCYFLKPITQFFMLATS